MIAFEDYTRICKGKDYGQLLDLLKSLRPDLVHQTKQLSRTQNFAKLYHLLENERGNKLIVRKALQIEVIKFDLPVFLQPKIDVGDAMDFAALQEAQEYWEKLPMSLQEKLTEANELIEEKRNLSNSLHNLEAGSEELGETVSQILAYSEKIDKTFAEKRVYDKYGTLPNEDIEEDNKELNDYATWHKQLASVQRMIRTWAAKLNNSNECLSAGEVAVAKWKKRKAELEVKREELKHKIANNG
jgi:hypothetical protein